MSNPLRVDLSDVEVQSVIDGMVGMTKSTDLEKWAVVSLWALAWPGWPESMPLELKAATIPRAARDRVRAALAEHVAGRPGGDRLLYVFDETAPRTHDEVPDEPDEPVIAVN